MKPIRTFTVIPSLPAPLERLRDLVYNLRWAWNHETIELFRQLDTDLWETTGHNPALMLGTIDQARLEAAAADEGFLAHLECVAHDFDEYTSGESTWFRRTHDTTDLSRGAEEQGSKGEVSSALLLRDPERLARILNDPDRPVQLIPSAELGTGFAGKAHPRDDAGKELIRQIVGLARQKAFRRRLVFLEDYDMAVARYLV